MQLFLELGTTFLSGALMYLLLEASKYSGKDFDWKVFYNTNIKPLKWTGLGAVAFILLASFTPQLMPFVEVQVGGEVDISSYEGIMLAGSILGAIIKNFLSREEKKKAAKM